MRYKMDCLRYVVHRKEIEAIVCNVHIPFIVLTKRMLAFSDKIENKAAQTKKVVTVTPLSPAVYLFSIQQLNNKILIHMYCLEYVFLALYCKKSKGTNSPLTHPPIV
jgi:hypothetical protein